MRTYGPIPSRRFGLSLGVDIVPHKSCPLDCIYCQLGPTDETTTQKGEFFSIQEILKDVVEAIDRGPKPDIITLAGSGEPGLYSRLLELIDELKNLNVAPVLLISNSVFLVDEDFKKAALKADYFAPSLDACDEKTFLKINKPHKSIDFKKMIEALKEISWQHTGKIFLEIMLIKGINDDKESLDKIASIVKEIRTDRIDLNTPVRPEVPERGALPCDEEALKYAQKVLGPKALPIASFSRKIPLETVFKGNPDSIISETLLRRPCTIDDLCASLSLEKEVALASIEHLLQAGVIDKEIQTQGIFYKMISKRPA